jgi:hypothetical protein
VRIVCPRPYSLEVTSSFAQYGIVAAVYAVRERTWVQVKLYLFSTSIVDKGEISASRPCRFTPSGNIECLGGSHSRSAHLGEEKQTFHLPRICPRGFGSPPCRLVTIPTELSSYWDFLIGTQITSKVIGFCLRYVLIFKTLPMTKSSPTPVRSRAISRRKVSCFVLGSVCRMTGGCDSQTDERKQGS